MPSKNCESAPPAAVKPPQMPSSVIGVEDQTPEVRSRARPRIALAYPRDWGFNRRLERHIAVGEHLDAEIHVICRNLSNGPRWEQVKPRLWVHRLPYLRGIRALSSHAIFLNPLWAWTVRRACVECQIDLVIVREFLLGLAVRLGAPRGVRVVVDEAENFLAMSDAWASHGRRTRFRYRLWRLLFVGRVGRWMERLSCSAADGVLVLYEENRDRLVSLGVDPRKIHVFHNVPVPELMQPRPQSILPVDRTGYDLRAAYLGAPGGPRGMATVVKAATELRKRGVRVQFVLVGDHRADCEEIARQRGVLDDLVITGQVPFREGLAFVQECDVCMAPHIRCEHSNTTIPNKLFDYMYMGKPVVVSDAAPMARIVLTHKCGIVFPSEDAGKLADALAYLAAHPKTRETMGANGRAAILKEYAWERKQDDLCLFLERTMERELRASP